VGNGDADERLVVTNGGAALAFANIVLGPTSSSTNNRITVDGGALRATNAAGTASKTSAAVKIT